MATSQPRTLQQRSLTPHAPAAPPARANLDALTRSFVVDGALASNYEDEIDDNSFWRSCPDPPGTVPRQRAFGSSASSPPHTLRRPQPRLRPKLDPTALRGDPSHHTNCCGVLGPMHAARAIAEASARATAQGGAHVAHSLAPAKLLVTSLRVADAYSERRRRAEDEELEWRKRFFLNRALEQRHKSFLLTQRAASRAALRSRGYAVDTAASPAAAGPGAEFGDYINGFSGVSEYYDSGAALASLSAYEGGEGDDAGDDLAAQLQSTLRRPRSLGALGAQAVLGAPQEQLAGELLHQHADLRVQNEQLQQHTHDLQAHHQHMGQQQQQQVGQHQQQQQQQQQHQPQQSSRTHFRRPVYVDRNIPWRRFGASVNDALAADGLKPIPQLGPPHSPIVLGRSPSPSSRGGTSPQLPGERAPSPSSPPSLARSWSPSASTPVAESGLRASPSVWLWDGSGTVAREDPATAAAVAADHVWRPSARPAAGAPFQLDGVFERRRPATSSALGRGGVVSLVRAF